MGVTLERAEGSRLAGNRAGQVVLAGGSGNRYPARMNVSITPKAILPMLLRLRWTYVYILLIPGMNWGAQHMPVVHFADGGNFSPLSVVVGLILVVRDFAQREVGHWIGVPLLIAALLSFILADPILAAASTLAFVIGESVDWAVYSMSRRPLSRRILISSVFSVPVDTLIFLYGWNLLNPGVAHISTFTGMIVSKLLAAYAVSRMVRKREVAAKMPKPE